MSEHDPLLPPLDGEAGPARRLTSARTAAMVSSILDAAARPAPEDAVAQRDPAPARSARRVSWLAAALVLALLVGAAAAYVVVRAPAPAVVEAPVTDPPAPAPVRTPAVVEHDPVEPITDEPIIDEPADEPADEPVVDRPVRRRPRAPIADDAPPAGAAAADVLAAANARRRARRWRDADALYQRVVAEHGRSDAAVVALVASASLRLDRLADPAGALRRYRRALSQRPAGPLAEEARWGIAEAHRALGDAGAEAAALRTFVEAHPGSAYAATARRRLAELEAR